PLALSSRLGADHRFLPPFPTRRSSDLGPVSSRPGRAGGLGPQQGRDAWQKCSVSKDCEGRRLGPLSMPECGLLDPASGQNLFNRDRKSTRLNSSHVKSSYAVFCLKKKN